MTTMQLDIPADHKFLSVLGTAVSAFVELFADSTLAYGVQLAVHEVCANAIDHAYDTALSPTTYLDNRLHVHLLCTAAEFDVEVMDNGRIFNPQTLPWPLPTYWEALDTDNGPAYRLVSVAEPGLDQERGRGMYLVRQLMDEVIYSPQAGQNLWRLVRKI